MHFESFSGVCFHLGRGMGSIKIHGAIHVEPLIIKLPEGLDAGCCQGKSPGSVSKCFHTSRDVRFDLLVLFAASYKTIKVFLRIFRVRERV